MRRSLNLNKLAVAILLLFLLALLGQMITGFQAYNATIKDLHGQPFRLSEYLASGHFVKATFENWEGEFLQMSTFVVLMVLVSQKSNAISNDVAQNEEAAKAPELKVGTPLSVKKGGFARGIYKPSLAATFILLFLVSFVLHFYGSLKNYNNNQILLGLPVVKAADYLGNNQFWFESFRNWQSEFLSVFFMLVFFVFPRQTGSPQS